MVFISLKHSFDLHRLIYLLLASSAQMSPPPTPFSGSFLFCLSHLLHLLGDCSSGSTLTCLPHGGRACISQVLKTPTQGLMNTWEILHKKLWEDRFMSILMFILLRQADGTVHGLHLNKAFGSLLKSKSRRETAATIHTGYTTPQRAHILPPDPGTPLSHSPHPTSVSGKWSC